MGEDAVSVEENLLQQYMKFYLKIISGFLLLKKCLPCSKLPCIVDNSIDAAIQKNNLTPQ